MKEIVKFIKEGLKITAKTKVNERPKYNYHPKTKEELKDYVSEDGSLNITEAVDDINEKLESKKTTTRSKKKKDEQNE